MNFEVTAMKRLLFLIAISVLAQQGCNDSPVIPENQQLVLQAYLYAGKPVADVTVMLSRPFSDTASVDLPVTDAVVTLIRNEARYLLSASRTDAGRYEYTGSDLIVRAGDAFRIEVSRGAGTATAETIVPDQPLDLRSSLSSIQFKRDSIRTPNGGTRIMITTTDTLVVTWSNPSLLPHYVVVESIDPARQPLLTDSARGPMGLRFVNEPTTLDFFRPMPFTFRYTGRHKLIIYRVNKEYYDLYKSRQQDSRALNEPLTNVQGGLGVFTAFNCDSVFVDVKL
jgi:hypothetical protein